ncbi:hypothetical protein [Streptomyces sp. OP7]|uniref:hypothetical protein n=1 Tax=Streptomyces sp. OP7 TaxID=3142462 RepID=UPI0032E85F39
MHDTTRARLRRIRLPGTIATEQAVRTGIDDHSDEPDRARPDHIDARPVHRGTGSPVQHRAAACPTAPNKAV